MQKRLYHHENLKQELIDAGICIVAKEGIQALSLRRLAAECGVSHAAPYKHFKSKEEMITAITEHVQTSFAGRLQDALDALPHASAHERLIALGQSYVAFMLENPYYLRYLFMDGVAGPVTAEILDRDAEIPCNPLAIFKETAIAYLDSMHAAPGAYEYDIVAMWGMVHGLTLMLANQNWSPREPYLDAVGKILRDNLKFD